MYLHVQAKSCTADLVYPEVLITGIHVAVLEHVQCIYMYYNVDSLFDGAQELLRNMSTAKSLLEIKRILTSTYIVHGKIYNCCC